MLAVEFARFLGLPFTGRANITDIVNAVCATAAAHPGRAGLRRRDPQPATWPPAAGAEVSDQLKYFSERLPATFIYAGIDVEAQGLFAGIRGRQIAGRFTLIPRRARSPTAPPSNASWRAWSPPWKPRCACTATARQPGRASTSTSTSAPAA